MDIHNKIKKRKNTHHPTSAYEALKTDIGRIFNFNIKIIPIFV